MKPSEAKVLEGLRKTTLAYLSDEQYAEVVEAVEKQGILGLTGAASRLVKGAVVKHGSHDQKTHGRKGGGGGSGGGGGMESGDRPIDSKRDNKEISEAMDDISDIRVDLSNMKDPDDSDNYIDDLSDDDSTLIDDALDDLEEAEERLNGAFEAQTTGAHLDRIESAQTRLGDTFDALRNADNRALRGLTDKVESVEERLENYTDLFLEGDND